eukprot:CAMPEP_0119398906 /NCGR_PEP_ID=MMETSP1334-20130426/141087_1 /TAXON_ID=127549 /ORGANISM="Calcidiscus leptoporus, Strain RCC1130" /LENGTH=212 /DNA_ID=CAMNT_0007422787 /DNA_START=367 /DNA_END=1007 /DNA_ORIENTATION=-
MYADRLSRSAARANVSGTGRGAGRDTAAQYLCKTKEPNCSRTDQLNTSAKQKIGISLKHHQPGRGALIAYVRDLHQVGRRDLEILQTIHRHPGLHLALELDESDASLARDKPHLFETRELLEEHRKHHFVHLVRQILNKQDGVGQIAADTVAGFGSSETAVGGGATGCSFGGGATGSSSSAATTLGLGTPPPFFSSRSAFRFAARSALAASS